MFVKKKNTVPGFCYLPFEVLLPLLVGILQPEGRVFNPVSDKCIIHSTILVYTNDIHNYALIEHPPKKKKNKTLKVTYNSVPFRDSHPFHRSFRTCRVPSLAPRWIASLGDGGSGGYWKMVFSAAACGAVISAAVPSARFAILAVAIVSVLLLSVSYTQVTRCRHRVNDVRNILKDRNMMENGSMERSWSFMDFFVFIVKLYM